MLNQLISLSSLLETHELPFVIIDSSLTIVGVNKAWEKSFSIEKIEHIGEPCCLQSPHCRHHELFKNLEPYESTDSSSQNTLLQIRGYPLLDNDGTIYLGESVTQKKSTKITTENPRMVGSSTAFVNYKNKLARAAQSFVPVFLMGETGTGKELAAEFIHSHSSLAKHELVIVDCTVLSGELFESELFGHEKGSFTGAVNAKKGLFELANKSTLFLDEIGDLPLSQQAKLLRALETGQFRRVGGTTTLQSEIRLVCATHRNLAEMVKSGQFREDLFYRLSVFPISIPALRQRLRDIPELVNILLQQISLRSLQDYTIDKAALVKLLQHQWPGNIRELKNCLQLASSLCQNQHIIENDINYMQVTDQTMPSTSNGHDYSTNPETKQNTNPLLQMESAVIRELLQKHQGNRKLIALEMDISERTLYRKLKRFELN